MNNDNTVEIAIIARLNCRASCTTVFNTNLLNLRICSQLSSIMNRVLECMAYRETSKIHLFYHIPVLRAEEEVIL